MQFRFSDLGFPFDGIARCLNVRPLIRADGGFVKQKSALQLAKYEYHPSLVCRHSHILSYQTVHLTSVSILESSGVKLLAGQDSRLCQASPTSLEGLVIIVFFLGHFLHWVNPSEDAFKHGPATSTNLAKVASARSIPVD